MPRLRNEVTGVIVNVDDATAKTLGDTAAGGSWVDADKAESKTATRKSSTTK